MLLDRGEGPTWLRLCDEGYLFFQRGSWPVCNLEDIRVVSLSPYPMSWYDARWDEYDFTMLSNLLCLGPKGPVYSNQGKPGSGLRLEP